MLAILHLLGWLLGVMTIVSFYIFLAKPAARMVAALLVRAVRKRGEPTRIEAETAPPRTGRRRRSRNSRLHGNEELARV